MKRFRSIVSITLSILISMMLVLLPLSGMVLTMVERKSLKLIRDSNIQMMNEISYHLSYVNETSQSLCEMFYNDSDVQRLLYAEEQPDQFEISCVIRKMAKHISVNEMIESIFFYNANSGSFNGTVSHMHQQVQDLMALLVDNNYSATTFTMLWPVYNDISKQYDHVSLAYVKAERDYLTNSINNAVVVNISTTWLLNNLSTSYPDGSYMVLLDHTGRILLDTNQKYQIEDNHYWDEELFRLANEKINQNFTYYDNGLKNVYTCVAVPETQWCLVNVQPYQLFSEFSHELMQQILFAVLLSMLIGMPIAYFMAKLINRPLEQVLKHITEQSPEAQKILQEKKDLTSLIEVFNAQNQKLQELEYYRQGSEIQLQKGKIKTVLMDNGIQSREKSSGILGEPGSRILVALLKIAGLQNMPQDDADERNLLRFAVVNVTEELLQSACVCQVVPVSGNKVAVLIWPKDSEQEEIRLRLTTVTEKMDEILDVSVSVFMDWSPNNENDLWQCYRQLTELSDYTLLYGARCVLQAGDLREQHKRMPIYPIECESEILKSLAAANETDTRNGLDEFIDRINKDSTLGYRNSLTKLLMSLQGYVHKINENKLIKIQANFENAFRTIKTADTSTQIYTEITNLLMSIIQQMPFCPQQKNRAIVQTVCKIIDTSYMDKELCGKMLATKMDISVGYLNALFKEEQGISLQKYINQVRLNYARDQIIKTRKPIAQIVENSGMETSSFYRLYKEQYGVSPREHRTNENITE